MSPRLLAALLALTPAALVFANAGIRPGMPFPLLPGAPREEAYGDWARYSITEVAGEATQNRRVIRNLGPPRMQPFVPLTPAVENADPPHVTVVELTAVWCPTCRSHPRFLDHLNRACGGSTNIVELASADARDSLYGDQPELDRPGQSIKQSGNDMWGTRVDHELVILDDERQAQFHAALGQVSYPSTIVIVNGRVKAVFRGGMTRVQPGQEAAAAAGAVQQLESIVNEGRTGGTPFACRPRAAR
jgi:hypothetical protein